jgi:hypothetical protein
MHRILIAMLLILFVIDCTLKDEVTRTPSLDDRREREAATPDPRLDRHDINADYAKTRPMLLRRTTPTSQVTLKPPTRRTKPITLMNQAMLRTRKMPIPRTRRTWPGTSYVRPHA